MRTKTFQSNAEVAQACLPARKDKALHSNWHDVVAITLSCGYQIKELPTACALLPLQDLIVHNFLRNRQ